MRAISQRKNGDENNVKDFTQKLPPISALDENQAVAKQSLTQFKKENPTNATKTETYDPSDLRNTFKAISLLAHLRSMSLANHLQQNARQQDEDGLADIEHKSQKQNDLMDNRYNSTGKSHLNMDDISGIDNFTLEFRKFIEESANGALRRNPRYSYLYEPISLAYAQNAFEAGMNSNKEDRIKNELKTNEMTNVENSPQFVNSSDFKRTQNLQRKTRQGRSSPEILQNEKPPASSNTSAEHHNVGKNVFEGQLTGNSTDETMSSGNFSEFVNGTYRKIRRTKITRYRIIDGKKVPVETRYDEELVLKTEKHDESDDDYFPEEKNVPAENSNLNIQEFEFKIDRKGDNMNDDTDQDDIKEVSILSNNHEQKIVYAAKSVEEEEEEEPKMSEYDIEENVPKIDFKKKCMNFKFNNLFRKVLFAKILFKAEKRLKKFSLICDPLPEKSIRIKGFTLTCNKHKASLLGHF